MSRMLKAAHTNEANEGQGEENHSGQKRAEEGNTYLIDEGFIYESNGGDPFHV